MDELKLLGIGTPVIDRFARVGPDMLQKWNLTPNSSNFVEFEQLEKMGDELGEAIFLSEAGDNARNVCDAFSRLERLKPRVQEDAEEDEEIAASGTSGLGPVSSAVAYAGSVGADANGEMVMRSLEEAGVQSLLCTTAGRTGEIIALIDAAGERTFAVSLGVGQDYPTDVPLPDADMVFATSITAFSKSSVGWVLEHQMDRAADQGIPLAISMESSAMLKSHVEEARKLAGRADYLFLNADEMKAMGLGVKETAELATTVFLKRGAAGSTVFEEGRKIADVPAFSTQALDSTGAGDAYAAGVLWGLSRDMTAVSAARLGSRLGAAVVGKFGAGLPQGFELE